jgi:hypothetical protein
MPPRGTRVKCRAIRPLSPSPTCGSRSRHHVDVLQFADLLAVAIDGHFCRWPLGHVRWRFPCESVMSAVLPSLRRQRGRTRSPKGPLLYVAGTVQRTSFVLFYEPLSPPKVNGPDKSGRLQPSSDRPRAIVGLRNEARSQLGPETEPDQMPLPRANRQHSSKGPRSGGRPCGVGQMGIQRPAVDCGVLYRVARTGGCAAVVEGATSIGGAGGSTPGPARVAARSPPSRRRHRLTDSATPPPTQHQPASW